MDSFSYMVTDGQQQVLVLRDYSLDEKASPEQRLAALPDLFSSDSFLRSTYRNIRIGYFNDGVTFIPARLFNPVEKKAYLEHLTTVGPEMQVRTDDLVHFGVKTVYLMERTAEDLLYRYFAGGRIFHQHSVFLSGLWETELSGEKDRLFVNVHAGSMQVVLLRGRQLGLANFYPYGSAKDFLYYLMLVFDQLKLDPEETPLFLTGHLIKDSEIYRLLYRYVRHLQFLNPPAFLKLGPKLSEHPRYFYFDLLSLVFCS